MSTLIDALDASYERAASVVAGRARRPEADLATRARR